MGRLRHTETGCELALLANHTVGRAERSDLVIADPRVSLGHAAVRWDGTQWMLRDLGSTNCTFLNQRPLASGESKVLRPMDIIGFAGVSTWQLVDDGCPRATAIALSGGDVITAADADILELDGVALYRGEGNVWHVGDGRKPDNYRDGDELIIGEQRYRLSLPMAADLTVRAGAFVGQHLRAVQLRFVLSPGEDRIDLSVVCDGEERRLGRQGNNRVLLWLARQRLADQRDRLPSALEGWRDIEELVMHTYRGDGPRLNTEVYRIRKRFSRLRLQDFSEIIQRDESQVRIGVSKIEIADAE